MGGVVPISDSGIGEFCLPTSEQVRERGEVCAPACLLTRLLFLQESGERDGTKIFLLLRPRTMRPLAQTNTQMFKP